MDFIKREKVEVGTKLVVELGSSVVLVARYKSQKLLTTYGTGGFKDEPVLLTVTKFGKREFTAIDRHESKYYFSNKTGKRNGFHDEVASVATESQIAEIMAIMDYNRKVATVRSVLDTGPCRAWDTVIDALTSPSPYYCPDITAESG